MADTEKLNVDTEIPVLNVVRAEPEPVILRLKMTDGTIQDRTIHIRPFTLKDEKWLYSKYKGENILDDLFNKCDFTKTMDVFVHQICDDDKEWLRKHLSETEHADKPNYVMTNEEMVDWLMKLNSSPYDDNTCTGLLACIFKVWASSHPHIENMDVDGEDVIASSKKCPNTYSRRMTAWLCFVCLVLGAVLVVSTKFWVGQLHSLKLYIWN